MQAHKHHRQEDTSSLEKNGPGMITQTPPNATIWFWNHSDETLRPWTLNPPLPLEGRWILGPVTLLVPLENTSRAFWCGPIGRGRDWRYGTVRVAYRSIQTKLKSCTSINVSPLHSANIRQTIKNGTFRSLIDSPPNLKQSLPRRRIYLEVPRRDTWLRTPSRYETSPAARF